MNDSVFYNFYNDFSKSIALTIMVTELRCKFKRTENSAYYEGRQRSIDSLLNFETVKYFGAEKYEVDTYREIILKERPK